jgi:hypothetical protein
MRSTFLLNESPFGHSEIYRPDQPGTYVPEMYGEQLGEFYDRFIIQPLTKEKKRQVIGAIWSSHAGDSVGRGFGKSMLMAEESKLINQDLGAGLLKKVGAEEEDIAKNPFLAGYCTFDQAKDVKTFPAALLDAVAFILESKFGTAGTVHEELRRRILGKVPSDSGYEGEAIESALRQELRKFRSLNIQLSHKLIDGFIQRLSGGNTSELIYFMRNNIGPRIKAAQGFNFVHVFNAFISVAGIGYVVYFIDQIENFGRFVRNGDRDVKILRESICQTSPTADMASFVFQMHGRALQTIEDWWLSENLPSLDFSKKINQARIVDLRGLQTLNEASKLAARYLLETRPLGAKPPSPLHPFPEEVIDAVFRSSKGNPRGFLRMLGAILENAVIQKQRRIDLAFIQPLLGDDESTEPEPVEDDFENPER